MIYVTSKRSFIHNLSFTLYTSYQPLDDRDHSPVFPSQPELCFLPRTYLLFIHRFITARTMLPSDDIPSVHPPIRHSQSYAPFRGHTFCSSADSSQPDLCSLPRTYLLFIHRFLTARAMLPSEDIPSVHLYVKRYICVLLTPSEVS